MNKRSRYIEMEIPKDCFLFFLFIFWKICFWTRLMLNKSSLKKLKNMVFCVFGYGKDIFVAVFL